MIDDSITARISRPAHPGADVMKRIAAPMVGGIVTTAILSVVTFPAIYVLWRWWAEVRRATRRDVGCGDSA